MAGASLKVPQISQDELCAFRDAHFSALAIGHFGSNFFHPAHPGEQNTTSMTADENTPYDSLDGYGEDYGEEEYEDDGLGYYEDGVKRTLTDEQIAMFRHSELEVLRRAREVSGIPRQGTGSKQTAETETQTVAAAEAGELSEDGEIGGTPAKKKKKKNNKNKNRRWAGNNGEPPVDLRKRTWDVVGAGLETLDYGEEDASSTPALAPQRRRVSYEDD